MGTGGKIILRGVGVHNLKNIDLDIPHRKLIVVCGVSGSGKSSLALDTLYAEGQRRYIESFSPYARQFLDQLEKPEAEWIDGIPPAIAVAGNSVTKSSRTTIGTATETYDYLRLLYAKIGRTYCVSCGREVHRDTSETVARFIAMLPKNTRYMVLWRIEPREGETYLDAVTALREEGFLRVVVQGRQVNLSVQSLTAEELTAAGGEVYGVVDRLIVGMSESRVREALETAFANAEGKCTLLVELASEEMNAIAATSLWEPYTLDGSRWLIRNFSTRLSCEFCHLDYATPEPRLFSFNSPLGACPVCEGFGNTMDIDMDLVIPDRRKTLAEGAIAPWNSPAYRHELEKAMNVGPEHGLPVDVPIEKLSPEALAVLHHGVPDTEFRGLDAFFAWLQRQKYKMHIRVFLKRWRAYRTCTACGGQRLRPVALATVVGSEVGSELCTGKNIADLAALKIEVLYDFLQALEPKFSDWERQIGGPILSQVLSRLSFLKTVGLGYLTLDRTLRTLSSGELRRVSLAAALGASLVNMLYVLDEPSIGLHAENSLQLLEAIKSLRNRDNTVVVVEHDEAIIRAADQVIEIGLSAGERGGNVTFQGTPQELLTDENSLTGQYLSGERGYSKIQRRPTENGWIELIGARGNNLQNLRVAFPLGCLCVVSGVSGAGKSTLVEETLFPAVFRRLRRDASLSGLPYTEILGTGQVDDVILVDQTPIGRSPRSNPVTYIKAFDEIRALFADTQEAKKRHFTAGHFSFNSVEGRCPFCNGDGYLEIDMQFLADVYMKCNNCHGTRYRKEILDVTYRNRNIAEVLEMTVREAFTFFRGSRGVQSKLRRLMEVGLDYVRLGQPANTLSGGEAQRLKLATYMSGAKKERCLFLLDEPTTGLHFSDIVQLLDCFDSLLSVGHSLIVIEHNLQLMKSADYIIDLGPGAAEDGGTVVVAGTPEEICACPQSVTGRFLKEVLAQNERK